MLMMLLETFLLQLYMKNFFIVAFVIFYISKRVK